MRYKFILMVFVKDFLGFSNCNEKMINGYNEGNYFLQIFKPNVRCNYDMLCKE